jgi:hypothetical protein
MLNDAFQNLPALGGKKNILLATQFNIVSSDIDVGISDQLSNEFSISSHPAQFHGSLQPASSTSRGTVTD